MFNKLNAKQAGSKGGKAKTKVKSKTAQANGKLGGRPPSKTLAERLLHRSIQPEQKKYIRLAFGELVDSERQQLEEYFQLAAGVLEDYYDYDEKMFKVINSTAWRSKSRRVPKEIRYLIKKFRLAANHFLRDVPAPKPYAYEYQQRSQGELEEWDRRHSGSRIPCPPVKGCTDVRQLPDFRLIELKHKRGVIWTVKDLTDKSALWTPKRAEVAIKWLNYEYPQSFKKSDSEAARNQDDERSDEIPF
jgi:hypothetical protein